MHLLVIMVRIHTDDNVRIQSDVGYLFSYLTTRRGYRRSYSTASSFPRISHISTISPAIDTRRSDSQPPIRIQPDRALRKLWG
jgi:hypothetical protein